VTAAGLPQAITGNSQLEVGVSNAAYVVLRRKFLVVATLGALFAVLIFLGIMQASRQTLLDQDILGNFYDGQAQALLDGHMNVDPGVPGFEGFRIGNETHIYQGIFPAVLRMPMLAFSTRFEGRLTGLSMLTAYCMAIGFLIAAAWRVRCLMRNTAAMRTTETICTAIASFGIAGSSLLFLSSSTWVYHEALLWGAALCLGSFTALIYFLAPISSAKPASRLGSLLLAVLLAACAVNTRTSIGLGPLVALGLVAGCLLAFIVSSAGKRRSADQTTANKESLVVHHSGWNPQGSTTRPLLALVVIVVGATAAVVLYAGVNFARFHSLFSVPLDKQVLVDFDPARIQALEANGNSLFGLKYAPSVLLQTLRPDAIATRSQFPFIGFPDQKPALIGDALFAERDWSSSVPSSEPLLFLAGCVGLVALIIPRRFGAGTAVTALRIPVVGAAAGGLLILAFGYIAQRYLTDLFPFLAILGVVGLQALAAFFLDSQVTQACRSQQDARPSRPSQLRGFLGLVVVATVVVTSFWSVWVNASLALQYGLEISPSAREANRVRWLDLQSRVGLKVDVAHSSTSDPLPEPGPRGQVLVVGDCDEMYRSSGSIWYLLQAGGLGGSAQLHLTRTADIDKPITLLQSGTEADSTSLVLQPAGPDQAQILLIKNSVEGQSRSDVSKSFKLAQGQPTDLLVLSTPRTSDVIVSEQDSGKEILRVKALLKWPELTPTDLPNLEINASQVQTPLCEKLTN